MRGGAAVPAAPGCRLPPDGQACANDRQSLRVPQRLVGAEGDRHRMSLDTSAVPRCRSASVPALLQRPLCLALVLTMLQSQPVFQITCIPVFFFFGMYPLSPKPMHPKHIHNISTRCPHCIHNISTMYPQCIHNLSHISVHIPWLCVTAESKRLLPACSPEFR